MDLLEFYNHLHDPATGRFSGRAASGREGFREGSHSSPKGGATIPRYRRPYTSKGGGPVAPKGSVKEGTARIGKVTVPTIIDPRTMSRRRTGVKQTGVSRTVKIGPKIGGKIGHPVTEPRKPLYSPLTGRINPRPVHAAFKEGFKSKAFPESTKRTTLSGGRVVRTSKTTYGRVISHVSSKGGADRAGFREGSHAKTVHAQTTAKQRNLIAEEIAKLKKLRKS